MKLELICASAKQEAVPELDREEKTLYFLIIKEGNEKVSINVGEKNVPSSRKAK